MSKSSYLVDNKNYNHKTNYIMIYVVNYTNINAKATCINIEVNLIAIEKTKSYWYL